MHYKIKLIDKVQWARLRGELNMSRYDCEEEIQEIKEKKYNIDILIGIGILKSFLNDGTICNEEYNNMKRAFIKNMLNLKEKK